MTFFRSLRVPERASAAALLLLASVLATSSAHAIPVRPSYWRVANLDLPLAPDGVLLLVFEDGGLGDFHEPVVSVLDPMGTALAGAIEPVDAEGATQLRIFRPNASLPQDGDYTLSGEIESAPHMFQRAVSELGDGMPEGTAALDHNVQIHTDEQSCCTTNRPDPGYPACVTISQREFVSLEISLALGPADSNARQFVYRGVLSGSDAPSTWRPAAESRWFFALEEAAAEYCFRVDAHRLTDGEEFVVAEGCVAGGDEALRDLPPAEDALRGQLNVHNCNVPSELLQDAWCEVNRAACAELVNEAVCSIAPYAETCAGFSNEDDKTLVELIDANNGDPAGAGGGGAGVGGGGAGGAGGTTSSGGSGGGSGAGGGSTGGRGGASGMTTGGDGGEPSDGATGTSRASSGCRASAAHGAPSSAALTLGLGLLTLGVARRRRRATR